MTCAAKLVYDHDAFLSLSRLDALLRSAAAQQGLHAKSATETCTGLTLDCDLATVTLDLQMADGETSIEVTLRGDEILAGEEGHRRLAGIVRTLLNNTEAPFVVWLDHAIRIPRDAFLSAFAGTASEAAPVAPRRVTARPAPSRTRRAAALQDFRPANGADAPGVLRQDAHVKAFDAHLRATLLRDASEEEIEALRAETGVLSTQARMSTWAVSLAVATVSLPVAVPVLVHNVVRGEDMRVASLAMGLAGLFVALDSSGAMAGIMSGL